MGSSAKAVSAPDPANDTAAILRRASGGDSKALAEARKLLTPDMWQQFGDLATHVRREWTELLVGKDELGREGVARRTAAMIAEVAGPSPTALERLLAERIAACWLQVQYVEHSYGQVAKESITLAQADYHQRRMTATQHRYLEAIRTLAVVRRLLRPAAVQVNIGARQVNIAGEGPTAEGGAPGSP